MCMNMCICAGDGEKTKPAGSWVPPGRRYKTIHTGQERDIETHPHHLQHLNVVFSIPNGHDICRINLPAYEPPLARGQ